MFLNNFKQSFGHLWYWRARKATRNPCGHWSRRARLLRWPTRYAYTRMQKHTQHINRGNHTHTNFLPTYKYNLFYSWNLLRSSDASSIWHLHHCPPIHAPSLTWARLSTERLDTHDLCEKFRESRCECCWKWELILRRSPTRYACVCVCVCVCLCTLGTATSTATRPAVCILYYQVV